MADGERVIATAYWHAAEQLTGAVQLRIEQVEHHLGNPAQIVRVTLWDEVGTQLGGYMMALHPNRVPGLDREDLFVDRLARPTRVSGGGVERG